MIVRWRDFIPSKLCYVSVKSKLQHPRRAYLEHSTPLPPRGGGNFIISLPGGGEFDSHALGVGNLNCTLDFMWNLWRGELSWGRCVRGFSWKRLCLCGQLVTRKGLRQALCRIWKYLNFNIFNIGFRLWIYECVKLCLQWNTIPIPAIQYKNIKLNRGQLLSPAACMLINKESDDACQWNGHDVVISIGGIFFNEALYVAWDTKKSWAFSDLVAAISPALHGTFVRSKYGNSVCQFLLYWIRIICCIYKDFAPNWRRFCRPSIIYVPVKCSRVGGIWSPEWTLVWGILTAFWT